MRQLKLGNRRFLALAFLLLNGCRTSQPPALSLVCIGDGFGGADCADASGNKVYKSPTQLVNFWMTTETDEQNLMQWCYDSGTPGPVTLGMQNIKDKINVPDSVKTQYESSMDGVISRSAGGK